MRTKLISLMLGLLVLAALTSIARAQLSSNYDARWSRLASGGGERQSANYSTRDILGQWVSGNPASINHEIVTEFFDPDVLVFADSLYLPIIFRP